MNKKARNFWVFLIGVMWLPSTFASAEVARSLIDLSSPTDLASRKPILIAHRGGVVTATAPECSLAAIRIAAEDGYDMVELDIQSTLDNRPVVFHDRTLVEDTGREGRVSDLNLQELVTIHLNDSNQQIPSLAEALELCRDLSLGVMLDFKTEGTEGYYRHVADLIRDTGLESATLSITSRLPIRRFFRVELKSPLWFRILPEPGDLTDGPYLFDRASAFDLETIINLHSKGKLAIPALNTFHYPSENNLRLAKKDALRLIEMGADGFQIDSVYQHFFGLPRRPLPGFDLEQKH